MPSLIYNSCTIGLERFIPEKDTLEGRKIVFWGLMQFQFLTFLVTWLLLLAVNYYIVKWTPWIDKIEVGGIDFEIIVFLVLARHLVNIIGSNCAKCALGFKEIKLTQTVITIKSLCDVFNILFNFLLIQDIKLFLIYSVFGYLVIELCVMLYWIWWLKGTFNNFKIQLNSIKKVWNQEIKLYSVPTILVNIISSVKERLPIFILADLGDFSSAAGVSVINRVCQFCSKLYSSVSSTVLPLLINNNKGLKYQTYLTNFLPLYFFIIGITLIFSMKYILNIWGFKITSEIIIISKLFILIFIISSTLRSAGIWLDYFGDRTRIVHWSISRCAVYFFCIFFIELNALNIVYCEFLSVSIASLHSYFTSTKFWPNKNLTFTTCIFTLMTSLVLMHI